MCESYLVVLVWQHVQQEAHNVLRELVLERPEDELLEQRLVHDGFAEGRQMPVLVGWFRRGKQPHRFLVLAPAVLEELAVLVGGKGRFHQPPVRVLVDQCFGHNPSHQLAHVVELHQHAAVVITVLGRPAVHRRVVVFGVVVAEVQQQPEQHPRHHGFRHDHQVVRHGRLVLAVVDAVVAAEPLGLHDRRVAAVAGTAGLRQEHVEIVIGVVAPLEAVPADGHARRDAAGPAPVGHHVRNPHQAALGVVVVAAHCKRNAKQNTSKLVSRISHHSYLGGKL